MDYYISPNDPQYMGRDDSESIQNAIDAAEASGIRTVVIPRICDRTGRDEWIITKSILLPSDITVILDDCHLTLADGIYENIFRNKNMYTDISLRPEGVQRGIRIIGRGGAVLDGGGGNDLTQVTSCVDGRPHIWFNNFILLHHVEDYVLENFKCINLRWWAINQVCCRHGRLSNLSFFNGIRTQNQDGINLRIGCSDILIENITGRTGDDVVALTALPCWDDKYLLVEGGDIDIHDITIRNVRAHTSQSVVALRNQDGAKIYRVSIENICDVGGEYTPWGVVRIGENNYFWERPSKLGETYEINVSGVYSRCRGTVFVNATLKDSSIRNVYAGGTSMSAISTFIMPSKSWVGCMIEGGVTMQNVVFENIHYNGTAEHLNDRKLNVPGTEYPGCALDFRCMREDDKLDRVVFRDIFSRDGAPIDITNEKFKLDIRN